MRSDLPTIDMLIAALMDGAPIKVWSYITTILGDLATDETTQTSAEVSGQMLTALTARVGIKPQAVRVALHRLRKDEWIDVRKDGRASHYRLSPDRLTETRAAGARIYAPRKAPPDHWVMTLRDPAKPADWDDGERLLLNPNMSLSLHEGPTTDGQIETLLPHETLPDWIRSTALCPARTKEYADLLAVFNKLVAALDVLEQAPAIDRMTLRLLVLHRWRRLILRHSAIAATIQADRWEGHTARTAAVFLFSELPRVTPDLNG